VTTAYGRLFDAILFSKPATNEEGLGGARYFYSHGYSFVRFPAIETISLRSVRYSEAQIEALNYPELLGPYERQVLAEAICAQHRFVILIGYEGSGKSSTVTTVFNHYKAHRLYMPNAMFRGRACDQLRAKLLTCKLSHVPTDLEKFWKDVDEIKKVEGSLREQTERLYTRWSAQLSLSMETMIGAPTLLHLIDMTLNMSEVEPDLAAAHGLRHAVHDVGASIGALTPGVKPAKAIEEVRQRIRTAPPSAQLMFWYAVLETAQLIIGDRLFAVVDNLDPFSEEVQEIVFDRLIAISQTSTFKVIAPMRPSTFQVGAYIPAANWYAHCGPSAVDVITLRLLSFLAKPDVLATYRTFAQDLKTSALQRVAEFLLLVNEPYSLSMSPAQAITALSGESIRRSMDLCQEVFLDENWRNSYTMPALPVFQQVLGDLEWTTLLRRLARSMADELADVVDEILTHQLDPAQVEERIEKRLVQSVKAALGNATRAQGRLLSHPLPEIERLIASSLGHEFRDIVRDSIWLQSQVIAAHSIPDDYLVRRIDGALPAMLSGIQRVFSQTAFQYGRERVGDLMRQLIAQGLGATTSGADGNGHGTEVRGGRVRSLPSPLSLMYSILRSRHFCNLLKVSGELSEIKIFILYYLASFTRYSCEPMDLWKVLMAMKYDPEEALAAINEMCSFQTRLLWVSHRSSYRNEEDFTSERYPIALSRAGWLYFEDVLTNPGCVGFMISQRLPPATDAGNYLLELVSVLHAVAKKLLDQLHRTSAKRRPDLRVYYAACGGIDVLCRMAMRLPRMLGARELSGGERAAIARWRELLEGAKRVVERKYKCQVLSPEALHRIHASPRGWRARPYAEITGGLPSALLALDSLLLASVGSAESIGSALHARARPIEEDRPPAPA
jgi:hypothetical protein